MLRYLPTQKDCKYPKMTFFKLVGLLGLAILSTAMPTRPQNPTLPGNSSSNEQGIVYSLTLPGFRFRRVKPLASTPSEKRIQHYLDLKRLPHSSNRPQRSARALFGQRDNDGGAFENVTSVNRFAVEYAVQAIFNGVPMDLVVDSGSADTCSSTLPALSHAFLSHSHFEKGLEGPTLLATMENCACLALPFQVISARGL